MFIKTGPPLWLERSTTPLQRGGEGSWVRWGRSTTPLHRGDVEWGDAAAAATEGVSPIIRRRTEERASENFSGSTFAI